MGREDEVVVIDIDRWAGNNCLGCHTHRKMDREDEVVVIDIDRWAGRMRWLL